MVVTLEVLLLALMLARMGRRSSADAGGWVGWPEPEDEIENRPLKAMPSTDTESESCSAVALGLALDLQTPARWFFFWHFGQVLPHALQCCCLSAELLVSPCLGPQQ